MTDATCAELSPERLSAILREGGHLAAGAVTEVRVVSSFETPPSRLARLALRFAPGTLATAPNALLCKQPKPHKLARGRRELRFYAEVAPLMAGFPLVPCYGAAELVPDGAPALLLADLSASHVELARDELGWEEIEAMAGLLAELHARWWGRPGLAAAAADVPEQRLAADLAGAAAGYPEFVELHGERLSPAVRRLFERYLADGGALLLARARGGPLTLCHPDSHQGNFLFPRAPGGPMYLIDWHGYQRWWGPADLAVLVCRCVPVAQLGRRDALLRRYYERLCAAGVSGYSWQECREDYRLGIVDFLASPIGYRRWFPWIERHLPTLLHEIDALVSDRLL